MDPNETLQRLREALTERLCKLSEAGTPCEYGDEQQRHRRNHCHHPEHLERALQRRS